MWARYWRCPAMMVRAIGLLLIGMHNIMYSMAGTTEVVYAFIFRSFPVYSFVYRKTDKDTPTAIGHVI